jgi:hypothetical protein
MWSGVDPNCQYRCVYVRSLGVSRSVRAFEAGQRQFGSMQKTAGESGTAWQLYTIKML